MKHTYIFEEGTWVAHGWLALDDGQETEVTGEAKIVHAPKLWLMKSRMAQFSNCYEIMPFLPGSWSTEWSCENSVVGRFIGLFSVVGDVILSTFASDEGNLSGVEYLHMVDSDRYENRGVLFAGQQRISSWAVTLYRVEHEKGVPVANAKNLYQVGVSSLNFEC